MFEKFGAKQVEKNGTLYLKVEFNVFFPDWGIGNSRYNFGGEPNIKEIKVFGTFQEKHWDESSAVSLTWIKEDGGTLWKAKVDVKTPGFYEYKYCVIFTNGEKRIAGDPCTKYSVEGSYEICGFVIDDPETYDFDANKPTRLERKPLRDLIIYELFIKDFTAKLTSGETPIDKVLEKVKSGYFDELGINAIEFMPWTGWLGDSFSWGYDNFLFFAVENSYVNSTTNPTCKLDRLIKLINECHLRGIHVIMDCVFNHSYADLRGKGFPYYSLYQNPNDCPFIGAFGGGGFFKEFDYNNECTHQFILDVCNYWIEEFGIDGIRFDYTMGYYDQTSGKGIKRLISDLKHVLNANDIVDFSLIIEHIDWYNSIGVCNDVDADACWYEPFYWISRKALQNLHNDPERKDRPIETNIMRLLNSGNYFENEDKNYPKRVPITYIETHDHAQVASNAGGQANWYRTQPWVIALFTVAGVPMIHNGQEFADDYWLPEKDGEGGQNRVVPRPVRWKDRFDTEQGKATLELYKKLIKIRKKYPGLCSCNFAPQDWKEEDTVLNDDGYGVAIQEGIVVYHRWREQDAGGETERFYSVLNFSDQEKFVEFSVSGGGTWIDLLSENPVEAFYNGTKHRLSVKVPSNYGAIYFQIS